MFAKKRKAFTLVELLVVISTIALLMAILMPVLLTAGSQARSLVCKSNLRQLVLANIGYSNENDGFCVPAASDIWKDAGGYHRWHGVRDDKDDPFDPLRGQLVGYLADGKVKECPRRVRFVKGLSWSENFEQGCGGYGYNMTYIGGRLWQAGLNFKQKYSRTARMVEISKPDQTLMFADCAMSLQEGLYIEYSFAEPPYFIINGKLFTDMYASPSIHFRHRGQANIGWADGHISSKKMAKLEEENIYNVTSSKMNLGWFKPVDNTPYDLE